MLKNAILPKVRVRSAKCDHLKLGLRTRVRADLNLDVRGACVRPKKQSQLTPCSLQVCSTAIHYFCLICYISQCVILSCSSLSQKNIGKKTAAVWFFCYIYKLRSWKKAYGHVSVINTYWEYFKTFYSHCHFFCNDRKTSPVFKCQYWTF